MTDRELMQMALNELERLCRTFSYPPDILYDTINALRARLANEFNPDWNQVEALQESLREHMAEIQRLRAALAQPEQEEDYDAIANKQLASLKAAAKVTFEDAVVRAVHKLYNTPPQREWQGLTDEEIGAMEKEYLFGGKEFDDEIGYWAVYRAIEAKLKEKNINLDTHFGVEK